VIVRERVAREHVGYRQSRMAGRRRAYETAALRGHDQFANDPSLNRTILSLSRQMVSRQR